MKYLFSLLIGLVLAISAASAYSQAMVIQPKPKPKQELRLPRILASGTWIDASTGIGSIKYRLRKT